LRSTIIIACLLYRKTEHHIQVDRNFYFVFWRSEVQSVARKLASLRFAWASLVSWRKYHGATWWSFSLTSPVYCSRTLVRLLSELWVKMQPAFPRAFCNKMHISITLLSQKIQIVTGKTLPV
jgi:hypothetical protein